MDKSTVQQILKLNKEFYQSVAEDFSKTRRSPWKGWKELIPIFDRYLADIQVLKVLDLGCGNGRFLKFLLETKLAQNDTIEYLGLDSTLQLLNDAKQIKYKKARFKQADIFKLSQKSGGKYDLVVAFGIMHHLPSREFRLAWLKGLSAALTKGGLLVLTFWNYHKTVKYDVANKILKTQKLPVKLDQLEENDYFLWWGGNPQLLRYCHAYSEAELHEITKILKEHELELVKRTDIDGKSGTLNTYLVFRKGI
jgi:tRNA (uracil-5-)-methyltransferase TRM9